jgi:D-cysteine desulfhydrase
MVSLFEIYPRLSRALPHTSLGNFPTPVIKLEALGSQIGVNNLYLKNDGLSASVYGGNKVRKLEFLLGEAKKKGSPEILTFGYAGSNHAAATAVWSRKLGLDPVSVLLHQPNASYVRKNLLVGAAMGSEFIVSGNVVISTVKEIARRRARKGKQPYIVAPGGSSPLGTIGYVNAAFELKRQIDDGALPCPDRIYVPLGSMGTAAGLVLGLKAVGIKTKVTSVRVVDKTFVNPQVFLNLFNLTRNVLRLKDPSFPDVHLTIGEIDIRQNYFGEGYGHFTAEGVAAGNLVKETECIQLDGTYTGKTMAALLSDAKSGDLTDETVLFWNTLNAVDLSEIVKGIDYRTLPKELHSYFERSVQPLDRDLK